MMATKGKAVFPLEDPLYCWLAVSLMPWRILFRWPTFDIPSSWKGEEKRTGSGKQ